MTGALDDDLVQELARAATGRPDAVVASWRWVPCSHPVDNLTTHRLDRLEGTLADQAAWSVFAKALHPASESPQWDLIPEPFHPQVLEDLDWRDEPRVYRSLQGHLPAGLRMPVVHRIDETASRATLWMEDVADPGGWDLARYRRTARALGRLAGRWPEERATEVLGLGRRPLARLFYGKIVNFDLTVLAPDAFWAEPVVEAHVDRALRRDLQRLADVVPSLVQRIERLPHAAAHGDATPHNFLEPGDGSVVAIDWSYGSCAAVGSDLAQLLAGRFECGEADPAELAGVHHTIVDGYLDGLTDEGLAVDRSVVVEALATNLAVRSVFSTLIVDDRIAGGRPRSQLLASRAPLCRFGLDLVDQLTEVELPG